MTREQITALVLEVGAAAREALGREVGPGFIYAADAFDSKSGGMTLAVNFTKLTQDEMDRCAPPILRVLADRLPHPISYKVQAEGMVVKLP